jgi:hypothetical protein
VLFPPHRALFPHRGEREIIDKSIRYELVGNGQPPGGEGDREKPCISRLLYVSPTGREEALPVPFYPLSPNGGEGEGERQLLLPSTNTLSREPLAKFLVKIGVFSSSKKSLVIPDFAAYQSAG